MKFFTAAAIAAILGAEAVLANPITLVPRTPRVSRRGATRQSSPKIAVEASEGHQVAAVADAKNANSTSNVSYSSNWAGAVLVGSGYETVVGTFTVPTPSVPSGGSSSTAYSASAWVGIDGDTCGTAILQTGIDFNVQGSTVSFDAWYEWYPDYAYTFSGFKVSAGDVIKLTAAAKSTSAGSVTIENQTTGKSVTHSFSGESKKLCETNAEWIVEDYNEGDSQVPFANFGTVTFTGASVTKTDGTTIGVTGAEILDIKQDSVLTSCSTSGSSTVICKYV
ncbi:acid proteinase [Ophiostoma piceae UAMH 11346]|uniref:Acid proteinase n=1 Tax=Ophiostoma piceae (strain UAMH 11346) TaxID=1262450 RepID=S3BPU5_OPHP1|nr:acid proteinase [Ophiostoma piceae UAMH 11346]